MGVTASRAHKRGEAEANESNVNKQKKDLGNCPHDDVVTSLRYSDCSGETESKLQ